MEIEPSTPVVAKKLWNMVRVLFFMFRKGIAKSKIIGEFHLMLKRGKKTLVNNLMLHHHYYSSFTCRSHNNNNNDTFISPRDYEFSCSNSPAFPFHAIKRHKHHHFTTRFSAKPSKYDENSSPLPGFGQSPVVRQLRVTDSPFPLKDEGDSQVDVAAQQFINKFYQDLNLQNKMPFLDSPYYNSWDR